MTNTTTGASTDVIVAMATFNGEAWLSKQIASIQEQTFTDWALLVSDDGSNDETVDIVRCAAKDDHRIQLLPYRNGASGHVANFEYLLESALRLGCETVFLADQDDLWQPKKLELMLGLVAGLENTPAAVFSDLQIISANGDPGGSYIHSIGMHGNFDIVSLLRQNSLAGCSMMVNRTLLELALPFPLKLQNHDWWLGLCAAASGHLIFCDEELVQYRQHPGNTIGSRNFFKQVRRFYPILIRQRRVFDAKVSGTQELIKRLANRNIPVDEDLVIFEREFRPERSWKRPWQLLFSRYRPKSFTLLLVQLVALMPLRRR